jgi:hypothetical protein
MAYRNRRGRQSEHCTLCQTIKPTTFRRIDLSPSSGGKGRGGIRFWWALYKSLNQVLWRRLVLCKGPTKLGSHSPFYNWRWRQIHSPKRCGVLVWDDGECPKHQWRLLQVYTALLLPAFCFQRRKLKSHRKLICTTSHFSFCTCPYAEINTFYPEKKIKSRTQGVTTYSGVAVNLRSANLNNKSLLRHSFNITLVLLTELGGSAVNMAN